MVACVQKELEGSATKANEEFARQAQQAQANQANANGAKQRRTMVNLNLPKIVADILYPQPTGRCQ